MRRNVPFCLNLRETAIHEQYLAQRGIFRNTGIREDDVESALLALDLRSEPIQIVEIRDISRNGRYIFPDFLRGLG